MGKRDEGANENEEKTKSKRGEKEANEEKDEIRSEESNKV